MRWCWVLLAASGVSGRASLAVEAGGPAPTNLVFANAGAVASAVSVRVAADYLTLEVTFACDAETWSQRVELLEDSDRALRVLANQAGVEVRARHGSTSEAGYGKIGSSMASLLGGDNDTRSHYMLATPLRESKENLLRLTARLHATVEKLKLPKTVTAEIGRQALALADAEGRRDAVRAAIGAHLQKDRSLVLGDTAAKPVRLRGLDGPLQVSVIGEREFGLWLPFTAEWGEAKGEATP